METLTWMFTILLLAAAFLPASAIDCVEGLVQRNYTDGCSCANGAGGENDCLQDQWPVSVVDALVGWLVADRVMPLPFFQVQIRRRDRGAARQVHRPVRIRSQSHAVRLRDDAHGRALRPEGHVLRRGHQVLEPRRGAAPRVPRRGPQEVPAGRGPRRVAHGRLPRVARARRDRGRRVRAGAAVLHAVHVRGP